MTPVDATSTNSMARQGDAYQRLLPADCWDFVFSFLTLKECLGMSQTSISFMDAVANEVGKRRKRAFLVQHGYHATPAYTVVNDEANRVGFGRPMLVPLVDGSGIEMKHHTDSFDWRVLPTVKSRVADLYSAVPSPHPLTATIQELKLDLEAEMGDGEMQDSHQGDSGPKTLIVARAASAAAAEEQVDNIGNFEATWMKFKRLCKAHRLHATILRKAVDSNPLHDYGQFKTRPRGLIQPLRSANAFSVSMEQFWGDVLIANYLMGNVVAGLVEGSRTEAAWTNQLWEQCGLNNNSSNRNSNALGGREAGHCANAGASNENDTANGHEDDESHDHDQAQTQTQTQHGQHQVLSLNTVYRVFVYLQSTTLRTMPFSASQIERLKLGSSMGHTQQRDGRSFVRPHTPFSGAHGPIRKFLQPLVDLLRMYDIRGTMNQFGPLGPSFRGRDHVRVLRMNGAAFCTKLSVLLYLAQLDLMEALPSSGPFLNSWLGNAGFYLDVDVAWMMEVSKACGQIRPMTVEPPLITVERDAV